MVKLICQRCKWEWNYSGEREYFCCCPNCKTSVKVLKEKKENDIENGLQN
ncbi:MAG: hypothetical protein PHS54_01355 [Clostridia bacterium]|nr:hypothetical protein [Clostridia bacterium]